MTPWRWRWARLRAMEPAEIPHRIREVARNAADRRGRAERLAAAIPALGDHPLPGWPVDEARLAAVAPSWRADVDVILADSGLEWLGVRRPSGTRRRFDLDPDGGPDWPDAYAHDVYRRHEATGSEIKLALEHARLSHLQLLAAAARTGDPRAADAVIGDLRAWLDAVRPYRGISFVTGIETALRLVGLCLVVGLLGRVPDDLREPLWRQMAAHALWIARYPSLHSSANNHRIAELTALIVFGEQASWWDAARQWTDAARTELAREIERQILPDGVGVEMSPSYQAFTMECTGTALAFARSAGRPFPADVEAHLAAGVLHLRHLFDDGGHLPRLGDDDEGVLIRTRLDPTSYVRDVTGAVASLLGASDAVPPGSTADLRTALWRIDALPPAPAPPPATFPQGGLTVLRPGGPHAPMVVVDHGPLGFGALAGHGHADALALCLHLDGLPVLVDPGTFRYNGADAWRRWIRGTAAHNTVAIDGRDQADQAGRFAWGPPGRIRLLEAAPEDGIVDASYEARDVVHRRRVAVSHSQAVVTDTITGTHDLAWTWQFAPDLDVAQEDGTWVARRSGQFVVRIAVQAPGELFRQADRPGWGQVSPRFGVRVPATTLVVRAAGPLTLVTRLEW